MRPLALAAGPPPGLASRLFMLDFWDDAGAHALMGELLLLLFGVPDDPPPVYDFRREGMMRTIVVGI